MRSRPYNNDHDRMSFESKGLDIETSEQSHTTFAQTEELRATHDDWVKEEEEEVEDEKETEKEEVEEEVIPDFCEKEEEQFFPKLYLAVERNDTEAVKRLLKSSVDVNVFDANIITPSQLYAIVNRLLNKNDSVDISNATEKTSLRMSSEKDSYIAIAESLGHKYGTADVMKLAGELLFYLAAKSGHAEVLDVLLGAGICDFVALSNDDTPLHVAVKERHTRVVEVILKHSCKISGRITTDEQIPQKNHANLAGNRSSTRVELKTLDGRRVSAEVSWAIKSTPMETMLSSAGHTALELAVESIQPKMVKILLRVDRCSYSETHLRKSFCCMIKTISPSSFRYEGMPTRKHRKIADTRDVLCYDIQHRMKCIDIKEIAHVLMNSKKFNVNHQDEDLNTLLHDVIEHCGSCFDDDLNKKSSSRHLHIRTIDHVVQLLLKKGADFSIKNAAGETLLIAASRRGCCHIVKALFKWEQKSEMKLDLDARSQSGATALIRAVAGNHVSVVRLLLNRKVSVKLHDYCGFTALHAAVYGANKNWFERHFDCKEFLVDDEIFTPFKEEIVELLLAHDETNVNAIDFIGNTPLDLAVKSSKKITSETFQALRNRGAIRKLTESKDEAPIHVARVYDRDRLIASHSSNGGDKDMKRAKIELEYERSDQGVRENLQKPEKFKKSEIETDDKGRTPLHDVVRSPLFDKELDCEIVSELLEIGNNVNAPDMYGKTPLHYAEMDYHYEFLVKCDADECTMDKNGYTPRDLRQIRTSMRINEVNVNELPIKEKVRHWSRVISTIVDNDQVTALSKRKLAQTVRIYCQSPCQKQSSEEAIWQVWIEQDFLRLNRRVGKLRPPIQRLIERLADGIKERDPRFECQPIIVGSAEEETKAVISADFDYNFKLTKFSRLCDAFPHPQGPEGYFQLIRTKDNTDKNYDEFACFFNSHQCLLTNEVISRFYVILQDVLHDPHFWQDEHLFEWRVTSRPTDGRTSVRSDRLCKTVELIMIHPIADGEGGFLFVDISIDIVACVDARDLWLGDQTSVAINPAVSADCCTLVFDQPRYDLTKKRDSRSFCCDEFASYVFSDTYARISFAPMESRIIRESSSLIKASFIICKLILWNYSRITYQLKTSLLFCMEALKVHEGCEKRDEDKITPKKLAFWVERIMFCFMEFSRHDVYPCYLMPSFRQRVTHLYKRGIYNQSIVDRDACMGGNSLEYEHPLDYSVAFAIYLALGPDDIAIDIPIFQKKYKLDLSNNLDANEDPKWEQFDWEELIRQISSRSCNQ